MNDNYISATDAISKAIDELYETLATRADVRTLIHLYMSLNEAGRTALLQEAENRLSRQASDKG